MTGAGRSEPTLRPLLPGDCEALVAHMLVVYPALAGDPAFATRYYRWKYFDLEGRDTGLPAGVVSVDAKGICGFIGCMPFRLRHGEATTPAAWIADWHLAPRARGRGVGHALLRSAAELVPTLGCIDGTPAAARHYRAAGFRELHVGDAWLRVRRALAFEWPRRRGLQKPLAAYRAAGHVQRRLRSSGLERAPLQLVEGTPSPELLAQAPYSGLERDAGYLDWLRRAPVTATSLIAVGAVAAPAGYAVLLHDEDRLGRRRGRILDLGVRERDQAASIYAGLAWHLEHERDVDYVETVAPTARREALAAAGFERRRPVTLWLHGTDPAPEAPWLVSLIDKDDAFRGSTRVP